MSSAVRRPPTPWSRLTGAAFLCLGLAAALPLAAIPPTDPPPLCGAGSIDDLLSGDAIDLGARGFDLRTPGDGYRLETFEVHSDEACDEGGQAIGEALATATRWRHGASGGRLHVGQREAAEPVPNVLEPGWASFWWQGYAFHVAVAADCGDPPTGVAEGKTAWRPPVPAPRSPADALPLPVPAPRSPADALPCGEPSYDLLESAIAALAPGLDLACFHRRGEGSWGELAGLGIGDPRSALPAGFTESYVSLSFLEPPAPGCPGAGTGEPGGVFFVAGFQDPLGDWAWVSAGSVPPGSPPSPGYVDDYTAFWSDERYQYAVSTWRADGSGNRELTLALAAALDPDFSVACLTEIRQLTPGEAAALGFHLAAPPPGFVETYSQLTAQTASPACQAPPPATYSFYWSFSDGVDLAIDASLYRGPGGVPAERGHPPDGGGEEPRWLSWTDAAGTSYTVFGYSYSGGAGPAEELLVAVAKSMDPTYGAP